MTSPTRSHLIPWRGQSYLTPARGCGVKRISRSGFVAWIALTLVLIVVKYPVLDSPPYNEYAETIWTEAAFLAETNFDFHQLFTQEAQVEEGGVRAYSYVVVPTLLAALLRGVGPTATFILYRVASLASAAAVTLWTFARIQRHFGSRRALAVTIAMYSLTYMVVGLEMLSLEMPLTLAVIAAVQACGQRRFWLAAGLCIVAFFIKPTALPATASLLVSLIAWRWVQHGRSCRLAHSLSIGIGAFAVVVLIEWSILSYAARDAQIGHRNLIIGPLVVALFMVLFTPYMIPLFTAIGLFEAAWWTKWFFRRRPRVYQSARRIVRIALNRQPELFIGAVYVSAVMASFCVAMFVPRYLISLTPFLAILLADVLYRRVNRPAVATALLTLLIAYNALNVYGRLLPAVNGWFISNRGWISLERSLEYRDDLRSAQDVTRFLAARTDAEPVLVGKLMTHLLSSPYLGYVDRPVHGYTVVDNFHLGKLRPAIEMLDTRPRSLLVVSIPQGEYALPSPAKGSAVDQVLWRDTINPPLTVHRHHFESSRESTYQEFYLNLLRYNDAPYTRCSMLASRGYDELGLAALKRRFAQVKEPAHLMQWLADQLQQLGSPLSAEAIRDVTRQQPSENSVAK